MIIIVSIIFYFFFLSKKAKHLLLPTSLHVQKSPEKFWNMSGLRCTSESSLCHKQFDSKLTILCNYPGCRDNSLERHSGFLAGSKRFYLKAAIKLYFYYVIGLVVDRMCSDYDANYLFLARFACGHDNAFSSAVGAFSGAVNCSGAVLTSLPLFFSSHSTQSSEEAGFSDPSLLENLQSNHVSNVRVPHAACLQWQLQF